MVPSPVAAEFDLGVVQVKASQTTDAHAHLDLFNQTIGTGAARVVEPAGPEVLGVDAQTKSVVVVARVNHHVNLFEGATDRTVDARRVLNENGTLGDSLGRGIGFDERALESVGDLAHDRVKASSLVRADV